MISSDSNICLFLPEGSILWIAQTTLSNQIVCGYRSGRVKFVWFDSSHNLTYHTKWILSDLKSAMCKGRYKKYSKTFSLFRCQKSVYDVLDCATWSQLIDESNYQKWHIKLSRGNRNTRVIFYIRLTVCTKQVNKNSLSYLPKSWLP